MLRTPLARLRYVALAEGWSYLLLLFIAMPLKYIWGYPEAVRVVGMLHGLLFVALAFTLLHAHSVRRWSFRFSGLIFAASLVPLGAFWMDRKLCALPPTAKRT